MRVHQISFSHTSCLHSVQLCRAQAMNCSADLQNITAQEFRMWVVPSWIPVNLYLIKKSGFEVNTRMSRGKKRKSTWTQYCHLELYLFLFFILQFLHRFCQLCHKENQLPPSGSAAESPCPTHTRIHLSSLLLQKLLQFGFIFCLIQNLLFHFSIPQSFFKTSF